MTSPAKSCWSLAPRAASGEAIYCTSKAAIDHMTCCLAKEWAPHDITVNAAAPTFIWTDATRPLLENAAFQKQTLDHIPLGRIGIPHDVTGAVVNWYRFY